MTVINYKDPSLLATLLASGMMSSADKVRLLNISFDGYATTAQLDAEITRAESAEFDIRQTIDGYAPRFNLTDTLFIDGGTLVDSGNQDGNVETPFSTIVAAVAATPKTNSGLLLMLVPFDYSGETTVNFTGCGQSALVNLAINATGTAGSFADQNFVTIPVVQSDAMIILQGCVVGNTSPDSLQLRNSIAEGAVQVNSGFWAQSSLWIGNLTSRGGPVRFDDCYFQVSGNTIYKTDNANPIELYRCTITSAIGIFFTGGPGILKLDNFTYQQWLSLGCTLTNGTLVIVDPVIHHALTHIAGGSDPLDGYHIPLVYSPVNYQSPIDGYIGEHIAKIDAALLSTSMVLWFPPSGDAGASLTALSAAEAVRPGGPRTIVQQPGTYTYTSSATLASNTDLLTHEQAININAIATHNDPQDSTIVCLDTPVTLIAVRTTDIVVGNSSFTVSPNASEISVGDKLYFSNGNERLYPAIVDKIIGNVVYVADPFEDTFLLLGGNSIIKSTNTPSNITIRGKGLFTGSGGARHIELAGATYCTIRDITLDDSHGWPTGGFGLSYDNGGYRNTLIDITLKAPTITGGSQYGLGFESNFHSTMTNCKSYGLHSAITFNDDIGCEAIDCVGVGNAAGYGIVLQTGGITSNVGCINCRITHGTYGGALEAMPTTGIWLAACTHIIIDSPTLMAAADSQINLSSTITGTDVEINNPIFRAGGSWAMTITGTGKLRINGGISDPLYYSSGGGISWGANMTGYIDGLHWQGTTVQPLVINAPITVNNCDIQGRLPITAQHTSGKIVIDTCKLDTNGIASGIGVYNAAGATAIVNIRDTEIILNDSDATVVGVDIVGTTGLITELFGVKTIGGSTGTGVKGKTGCPVLVGTGNDFSSCTTQYDATATSNATHIVTASGVS